MAEIKKAGVPGKDTAGQLGDIYINTLTGDRYKLAYIFETTTYDGVFVEYDWDPVIKFVVSNTVLRIEVVSELPGTEENGVLYIVK